MTNQSYLDRILAIRLSAGEAARAGKVARHLREKCLPAPFAGVAGTTASSTQQCSYWCCVTDQCPWLSGDGHRKCNAGHCIHE